MKNLNIILFTSLFLAFSCNKDQKATHIEGVGTTAANSAQAKNNASSMLLPPGSTQPPTAINPAVQQAQIQQNGAQPAAIGEGLNPEHGKPGHRCDIPVGAPLNSPAKGNTQPVQASGLPQQITINPSDLKTTAPAPASTQKTAPGMNPPHGEPGHRCDIAVGAPLNSPAGKTTTQTVTPTTASTPAKTLPATVAAAAAPAVDANGKALALNPAHGQPGHRCDIAVGAPLK